MQKVTGREAKSNIKVQRLHKEMMLVNEQTLKKLLAEDTSDKHI